MTQTKDDFPRNHSFVLLTCFYTVILIIVSSFASYFSYTQKKEEAMADVGIAMAQLEKECRDTLENFWQVYMPIFEDRARYNVFLNYFALREALPLSPQERAQLSTTLASMAVRSTRIQWIAVNSDKRETNYIYYVNGDTMAVLPDDFPYKEKMLAKTKQMEVYGKHFIDRSADVQIESFAICGGSPLGMGAGKVLVGYSLDSFNQIVSAMPLSISGTSFHVLYDGKPLYASDEDHGISPKKIANDGSIVFAAGNERYYTLARGNLDRGVSAYTLMPYLEAFFHFHMYTPYIFAIVVFFAIVSILIYWLMLNMIHKEVKTIQDGLAVIGENHLTHRIPVTLKQNGLPQVASAINQMTQRLQENIDKAYIYQLKQREAELGELQSKFNPHFLYNTLNMLSTRCYQNDDPETAALIIQLATIFRGFLGSRTFVPISEELAFSKKYLALFCARYEDRVHISFDIDTQILQYGIIRNILQPLIENYFVHGFDDQLEDNTLLFRGRSHDENNILITVIDNGIGMSDRQIDKLNARLHEPVSTGTESYGLKNIHQRLNLFYGGNCGLSVSRNGDKGLCVTILMRKMTCDEYERSRADHNLTIK